MLSPLNGLLSSNITGTALYRNGARLGVGQRLPRWAFMAILCGPRKHVRSRAVSSAVFPNGHWGWAEDKILGMKGSSQLTAHCFSPFFLQTRCTGHISQLELGLAGYIRNQCCGWPPDGVLWVTGL